MAPFKCFVCGEIYYGELAANGEFCCTMCSTAIAANDEGFQARQRGEPLSDNPYAGRTDDHIHWHHGWLDLHEHLTRRANFMAKIDNVLLPQTIFERAIDEEAQRLATIEGRGYLELMPAEDRDAYRKHARHALRKFLAHHGIV